MNDITEEMLKDLEMAVLACGGVEEDVSALPVGCDCYNQCKASCSTTCKGGCHQTLFTRKHNSLEQPEQLVA